MYVTSMSDGTNVQVTRASSSVSEIMPIMRGRERCGRPDGFSSNCARLLQLFTASPLHGVKGLLASQYGT